MNTKFEALPRHPAGWVKFELRLYLRGGVVTIVIGALKDGGIVNVELTGAQVDRPK
jgi:hypothetical protein